MKWRYKSQHERLRNKYDLTSTCNFKKINKCVQRLVSLQNNQKER